jgi:hypothetical protein
MSFPVETTTGETVMVVEKEPLGQQGAYLLHDEDGNTWVQDYSSGMKVVPYEGQTGSPGLMEREGGLSDAVVEGEDVAESIEANAAAPASEESGTAYFQMGDYGVGKVTATKVEDPAGTANEVDPLTGNSEPLTPEQVDALDPDAGESQV